MGNQIYLSVFIVWFVLYVIVIGTTLTISLLVDMDTKTFIYAFRVLLVYTAMSIIGAILVVIISLVLLLVSIL